nr:hypothetical protein [Paludibacteraceae bacterium]
MLILILSGLCLGLKAQDTTRVAGQDSAAVVLSHRDSVRLYWKPDAMRAVWMGAIIPGYGQIYNRSYWKLPIVYGAFFGCAYAITWTNGMYTDYKTAYRDILTDRDNGTRSEDPDKSYIAILPDGYTISRVGGFDTWTTTLSNQQNRYRRYRDLSIVAAVAVYALSLIDAYVDAQLFDYDISDDLSLQLDPTLNHDPFGTSAELHLAFNF